MTNGMRTNGPRPGEPEQHIANSKSRWKPANPRYPKGAALDKYRPVVGWYRGALIDPARRLVQKAGKWVRPK